jgi:hypothetical protein
MYRVLITGSREFSDRSIIAAALTKVYKENGKQPFILCHGDARGADRISGSVARKYPKAMTEERHPANWRPNGPGSEVDNGAGNRRNKAMVALGADVCLAFLKRDAKNIGTRHCMRVAREAGIPVIEHWQEPGRPATDTAHGAQNVDSPAPPLTGDVPTLADSTF